MWIVFYRIHLCSRSARKIANLSYNQLSALKIKWNGMLRLLKDYAFFSQFLLLINVFATASHTLNF